MEQADQVSGVACLVGQPETMINFICDDMELSQPAFTISRLTSI